MIPVKHLLPPDSSSYWNAPRATEGRNVAASLLRDEIKKGFLRGCADVFENRPFLLSIRYLRRVIGAWSRSRLTLGERRRAHWTGRQSISVLINRDRRPFTLKFAPTGNLELLINLICMFLDCYSSLVDRLTRVLFAIWISQVSQCISVRACRNQTGHTVHRPGLLSRIKSLVQLNRTPVRLPV